MPAVPHIRTILCLLMFPAVAAAQTGPGAGSAPEPPGNRALSAAFTCAEALDLVTSRAAVRRSEPLFSLADRREADEILRRLTNLALGSPRCPAAVAMRGLVKWELQKKGWPPKDAPGQRPGVPWDADAVYDLTLAGKEGDKVASAAGVVAVDLLLTERSDLPWLVREVGPDLLEALAHPSDLPDSTRQLQRGRLAAWLWVPSVADSAFSAYGAAGGDSDRLALELGRVRLATGAAGGEELYYRAAASPDPLIGSSLRTDIELIADSAELAGFDATTPSTRPAFLRDFWEQRDLESLKPRGTRLADHYARIATARTSFRLLTYPRRYELDELWVNRDAEFDDRGLVFIRHGMPDDTASAIRAGACPNSSWLYRRADGNLIFHFLARENPDDWRLVETLANVGGGSGATTRVRQAGPSHSCGEVDGLLESRARLDPIYARLAVQENKLNWERELSLTTRSRKIGTTTDSDVIRYSNVLDVAWRAYGLLGDGSFGRILLLVSVPGRSLVPISMQPIGYGFEMRLVGTSGPRLIEVDTVRRLAVARAPVDQEMLTFVTELAAEPGTWSLGATLEQPADSSGQFFRDPDISVPPSGGQQLAMSDIVLGATDGGRPWNAPDGPFPLSSTGTYFKGQSVPIYYEIAGVSGGTELETEITFAPEGQDDGVTISFEERASAAVQRIRRELGTERLDPGRYSLRVTIRAPGGGTATRETSLYVAER